MATDIAQGKVEGSPPVTIARYFLADQLLQLGNKERALETLSPSIIHAPGHWLTWLEQAHILYALDRKAEAKSAAVLAVEYAPTSEKAEQLKHILAEILGNQNTQPLFR